MKNTCFWLLFTLGLITSSVAQTDTLHLADSTIMVGEIKSLRQGVLKIETAYSDGDHGVDIDGIITFSSAQKFLVVMENGTQYSGIIKSTNKNAVTILLKEGGETEVETQKITRLKSYDEAFIDRLNAKIAFGFQLTKANNLRQYSLRSSASYNARTWIISGNFNSIRSSQDLIDATERNDGNVTYDYILGKNWFLQAKYNYLSDTDQKIKLRSIGQIGLGKYLIRNNHWYWSLSTGLAFNNESYLSDPETEELEPQRQTGEAYFTTELSLFDMGDIDLKTNVTAYPSLSDQDRFRLDWTFDLSYDLPLDFFIGVGTTINYDNKPAVGADELGYVLSTTIGWQL